MKMRINSAVAGMLALLVSSTAMAGDTGRCCLPDGTCEMVTVSDCDDLGGVSCANSDCMSPCPPPCLPETDYIPLWDELTLGGADGPSVITKTLMPNEAGVIGFQIKFDYCEDFVPDSSWASDVQVKVRGPLPADNEYVVGGLTNLPDADEFWSFQGEVSDPPGTYGCTDADVFLPAAWLATPLDKGDYEISFANDWLGDTTPNTYSNIMIRFIKQQPPVDPGACCLTDQTCVIVPDADACAQLGGRYLGDGSTCIPNECPPTGACCFFDQSCQILAETNCMSAGGILYLGDDTTCVPNECPPTGACCFFDQSCEILDEDGCTTAGGIMYLGDGTTCVPNPCLSTDIRACCFQDGSCLDRTSAECTELGGVPQAPDSACDTTPCPVIRKGACCLADQVCVIVTGTECETLGGRYQGDNTLCEPNPCPATGACCFPCGLCEIASAENCNAAGGTYSGDDTVCTPGGCPLVGACCFSDGTCIPDLTQADCNEDLGGTWQGCDVPCTDDLCPPTKGACCLDGGACTVVTPAECDTLIGDYQGDNVVCSPGLCPIEGACCFPDGTCLLADQDDCTELGGLFQGDNVPCNPCPPPAVGACCLNDGTCVDVVPAECTDMGGYFEGIGTQCATIDCTGACCLPDGSCEDLTAGECRAEDGDFRGSDTECATTDCPGFFARALIIKQGACPAPIHPDSNGLTKMLVVGDTNLDVLEVDLSTLRLSRCDGVGNFVLPERIAIKDLNHPEDQVIGCEPGQNPCACNQNQSSDQVDDIELKFRTSEMRDELELGNLPPDTIVTLSLTGELDDGREFTALDCVRIVGGALPDGASRLALLADGNDVWIDSAPPDNIFDDGGFADFERIHPRGTVVHLTAPPAHDGANFAGWKVDGITVESDRLLVFEITDDVHVVEPIFEEPIAGDVNGDGVVGLDDLLAVLIDWGACVDCPADFNGDGVVDFTDLLMLLGNWG